MRYVEAGEQVELNVRVNGQGHCHRAEPRMLLCDFLREHCGLTGTHVGCEHGVCGACTVRVDGKLRRACLTLAIQVDGCEVQTVEGLAPHDGPLSALQRAFAQHHALQCGFCTPGILMSMSTLIAEEPDADEARVRDVLGGHLCRCTGYHGIVAATLQVLEHNRGTRGSNARADR